MSLRYITADGAETEVQVTLAEVEDETGYLLVTDAGDYQHGDYFRGEERP